MYRMTKLSLVLKFKIFNFVQKNVSRPLQLINQRDYIVNPLHKVSKIHSVSLIVSEITGKFTFSRKLLGVFYYLIQLKCYCLDIETVCSEHQ